VKSERGRGRAICSSERTIRGVTFRARWMVRLCRSNMAESLRLSGGVLILAEAAPQLEAKPPKQ